jgi:hypothetical protein
LYYIRRLANPFQWEYARNVKGHGYDSSVWFDVHSFVFTTQETSKNTSHGHVTKEEAQKFKEKHLVAPKVKVERVDGFWFMCKNKLSKIKFRRNK